MANEPSNQGGIFGTTAQINGQSALEAVQAEEIRRLKQQEALQGGAQGGIGTAYTSTNAAIEFEYAAVPASSLVTSHNADLSPNLAYDQSLQGRDRTRAASAEQIASIAASLNPQRLGASPLVSEGAPIIGPDLAVESGNGRSLAILQAYSQNLPTASAYQQHLVQNAAQFGLDPQAVAAMESPVLVRVRRTEMDAQQRAQFATEANYNPVGALSDVERAQRDASALMSSGTISQFLPSDSGGINPKTNRAFLSSFASLLPESERASFVQADGSVSAGGLRQAQNALLAAAYPDTSGLSRMLESTDDNARNIGAGMLSAAGDIASLRQGAASGELHPLDISGNVSEAANLLSRLREEGRSLENHLATGSLFGEAMPQVTEDVARFMDANKRSGKRIGQVLSAYADSVQNMGSPDQSALFDMPPPSASEVFGSARASVENTHGVLASAGGVIVPEEIAAARAEEANQRAERQRVLTEAARARSQNAQSQRSSSSRGWDAEAANARASARPMATFATRQPPSTLTAPADAGAAFDAAAYDASRLVTAGGSPLALSPEAPSPQEAFTPPIYTPVDPFADLRNNFGPVTGTRDTNGYAERREEVEAQRATPPPASISRPRYASAQEARDLDRLLKTGLEDEYAQSGRVPDIGGEKFTQELTAQRVEAELIAAPTAPEAPLRGVARLKANFAEDLKSPYGALNYGFALGQIGQGAASAYEKTNSGNYVTPEQQNTANAAMLPGAFALAGTAIGSVIAPGAGSWVGGLVGGGVGSVAQSVIGANNEREQSTRESAERLAAALGQAQSAVEGFKGQIEATGVPVQQFAASLASAGSVGTYGPNTVAGIGALTNSFGSRADEDWKTISRYTSDPLLHGMGNRFSSGTAGSGDITSLAYDAAEQGDFSGLKTLQQAASDARFKNDPKVQEAQGAIGDIKSNWWMGAANWVQGKLTGSDIISGYQDDINARKKTLGEDPDAAAENTLVNQFADIKSRRLVAESTVKSAGIGISLVEAQGGSAADVVAASRALFTADAAGRTATRSEIGLLQQDLANPINAGRKDELTARIADAQARLSGYDLTDAQRTQANNAVVFNESGAAYGLRAATQQQAIQAGFYGGRTFAEMTGAENGILSAESSRANEIRREAYRPGVGPADRDKMLAEATGLDTDTLRQKHVFEQNIYGERLAGLDNAIAGAGQQVGETRAFGTPGQVFSAQSGELDALRAKFAELTAEITRGGLTADELREKEGQLIQVRGQAVSIAAQQRDERIATNRAMAQDDQTIATVGVHRQAELYGSGSVNVQAIDAANANALAADRDAISQYAPGSQQRKNAEAQYAAEQARQAEQHDALNVYTPGAAIRLGDVQGQGNVRRAQTQFELAQIAPYRGGPDSDPLTAGAGLQRALRADIARTGRDQADEDGFRAQRIGQGKWDDLAQVGYEQNKERREEARDADNLRLARVQHDRDFAMLRALPETIIGGGGTGNSVSSFSFDALSAAYSPNVMLGSWGSPRRPSGVSMPGSMPGNAVEAFQSYSGSQQHAGAGSGGGTTLTAAIQSLAHGMDNRQVAGLLQQVVTELRNITNNTNARTGGQAGPPRYATSTAVQALGQGFNSNRPSSK